MATREQLIQALSNMPDDVKKRVSSGTPEMKKAFVDNLSLRLDSANQVNSPDIVQSNNQDNFSNLIVNKPALRGLINSGVANTLDLAENAAQLLTAPSRTSIQPTGNNSLADILAGRNIQVSTAPTQRRLFGQLSDKTRQLTDKYLPEQSGILNKISEGIGSAPGYMMQVGALGGALPGVARVAALRESQKGPVEALKSSAKDTATAGLLSLFGGASPLKRALAGAAVGSVGSLASGGSPEDIASQGALQAGFSAAGGPGNQSKSFNDFLKYSKSSAYEKLPETAKLSIFDEAKVPFYQKVRSEGEAFRGKEIINKYDNILKEQEKLYPNEKADLTSIVSNLQASIPFQPELKTFIDASPNLKSIYENPQLAKNLDVRTTRQILTELKNQVPDNVLYGKTYDPSYNPIRSLITKVQGAFLDSFSNAKEAQSQFREDVNAFNSIKSIFRSRDGIENAIKRNFGGAESRAYLKKVLPQETYNQLSKLSQLEKVKLFSRKAAEVAAQGAGLGTAFKIGESLFD